ncbi:MAG: hypothetical protein ABI877_17945 [Gemmatimonadaceae bacterium]
MAERPPPNSNAPVPRSAQPLDRAALERVLARAAELQAGTAEPSEGMTEPELEALGGEVGITADYIRRAVAEERTRVAVPEERGVIGSWFGASMATASRVVRGTPAQVLASLDEWMQREEGLRPRRRFTDRLTWEARRDFLASLQSGLNFGGRAYALTSAGEVGATAVAIDAERTMVRLDADLSRGRGRSLGWSGVAGGALLLVGGGLVAFTVAVPGASVPIGLAGGGILSTVGAVVASAIASAQRGKVARAQLALEQILDRVEHNDIKLKSASLLDLLVPPRK